MPSDPNSNAGDDDGSKDVAIAKAAGFLAFSGIALSILKALTPKPPQPQLQPEPLPKPSSPPLIQTPPPPLQPSIKKSAGEEELQCGAPSSSARTVEIVRGDTLWGLSRKYGVTIDAIKEANGITGDTIYAGKKLVIP